jgi:hypothetical protein
MPVALADDIAALIVTPAQYGISFLPDQAVLHAAAKSHETRITATTATAAAAYVKPTTGIPSTDLTTTVQGNLAAAVAAYVKPTAGIPSADLTTAVQGNLAAAAAAYVKPVAGIPSTDLTTAVQGNLTSASTAVQIAGDLGGTPSAPTVPRLVSATTATVGLVQLAGALSGTATAPTLVNINNVGPGVGLNGNAAVAKAAAIAAPVTTGVVTPANAAYTVADQTALANATLSNTAAINALRVALTNIGVTS